MKTIEDVKLKRCPLCGGEAIYQYRDVHRIFCMKCGCSKEHRDDIGSLVAQWNNRTNSSVTFQLIVFTAICSALVAFFHWPLYFLDKWGYLPDWIING